MFSIEIPDKLTKPATPAECALLLAIPLDRDSFFSDLRASAKDYVRQFKLERANQTDESLWEAYRPYASLALEVCEKVRRLGVHVFECATVADFHRSVAQFPVTTLFAHWRSALFRAEDIAFPSQVAAVLRKAAPDSNVENSSDAGKLALANRLNAILKAQDDRFDDVLPGSDGEATARQYKWHVRRLEIERQLGPAVTGGASVEFSDGLILVSEILRGFSADFSGVLDLTVCQSVVLGEEIRRKCRRCLVLTSARLTSFDFRLALYAQVVDVLAREPMPFEDAMLSIRKFLIQRYARKHQKDNRPSRRS